MHFPVCVRAGALDGHGMTWDVGRGGEEVAPFIYRDSAARDLTGHSHYELGTENSHAPLRLRVRLVCASRLCFSSVLLVCRPSAPPLSSGCAGYVQAPTPGLAAECAQ